MMLSICSQASTHSLLTLHLSFICPALIIMEKKIRLEYSRGSVLMHRMNTSSTLCSAAFSKSGLAGYSHHDWWSFLWENTLCIPKKWPERNFRCLCLELPFAPRPQLLNQSHKHMSRSSSSRFRKYHHFFSWMHKKLSTPKCPVNFYHSKWTNLGNSFSLFTVDLLSILTILRPN